MATQMLHGPKNHHSTHESLWCPECREYGLVYCDHANEDVWECLYCNYKVNLTRGTHQHGHSQGWEFPWEVIIAAICVALFLYFTRHDFLGQPIQRRATDRPTQEYVLKA